MRPPLRWLLLVLAVLLSAERQAHAAAPPTRGRVDGLGDPLPPGAVLRLGTNRFLLASTVRALGFLDRDTFVAADEAGRLSWYDAVTGRLLRSIPLCNNERPSYLSADG